MKTFIKENWYKLMIGTSLLMASFGFMIRSISPAFADNSNRYDISSNYRYVPTNSDGSINVKLSDEQIDQILPKNEDGSINVKTAAGTTMDVNIETLRGIKIGKHDLGYSSAAGGNICAMSVKIN